MAQCLGFFLLASLGSSSLMDMDLLSVMNTCASGCSVSSSAGPCSFSYSRCFISRFQSQLVIVVFPVNSVIMALKRKRCSQDTKVYDSYLRTPPTSSTNVAENHSPVGVGEEIEIQIEYRYELGEEIGEGGFGSVYEGKRLEDGLEVAVKIARKPSNMKYIYIAGHPEPLPLEIGLLILAHRGGKVPEIIELLDWQDQQDYYIMILERPSPCVDLFDFTMSLGSISERQAQGIMAQATMAGLMCCRRGVFHRDIKLENLLVNTDTLEVKLIDFGCGVLLQEFGYDSFCGTKEYFPPEYFLSNEYHAEPSTVWSLGVLLFLLLCQRFPEATDMQKINDGNWTEPGLSEGKTSFITS
ncbi:serine/threonine-protein kinase pim-2-like [Danio aesculapii]|uniref:serine/threonine-protein kinase pim-2-like n=1 Tax=Danio aesculapii TaxID=1142201 RepID=UPI0024BF9945|nr:serine/threonine-protein kinase pim-2-like [Danio aesculapii]